MQSGLIFCGPGGSRTHVQTRNFEVFYMLILQIDFRLRVRPQTAKLKAYSVFFSSALQTSVAAISL